jgi:hypothetical protein
MANATLREQDVHRLKDEQDETWDFITNYQSPITNYHLKLCVFAPLCLCAKHTVKSNIIRGFVGFPCVNPTYDITTV